jgi:hypothetical protein
MRVTEKRAGGLVRLLRLPATWLLVGLGVVLGAALTVSVTHVADLVWHDVDGEFDEHAWRADLETIEGPLDERAWQTHVAFVVSLCGQGDAEFQRYHSVGNASSAFLAARRVDISYVCPERLPVLDEIREGYRAR